MTEVADDGADQSGGDGQGRKESKAVARLREKCAAVVRPLLEPDETLQASFTASNQRNEPMSTYSASLRKNFIVGITDRRIVVVRTGKYRPFRPSTKAQPQISRRTQRLATETRRMIHVDGEAYWVHAYWIPTVAAADEALASAHEPMQHLQHLQHLQQDFGEQRAGKAAVERRKVTLRSEQRGPNSHTLLASTDAQGNLHLHGHDLGPVTAPVSDDGEYEYFKKISAAQLPQLRRLLDIDERSDILDALQARWSGAGSWELERRLADSDIHIELWNYH